MQRPICEQCGQRPKAINYYKNNRPYFRRKCEQCLRDHKPVKPLWVDAGYKVNRVVSIIDRQEDGEADAAMKWSNLELVSLYKLEELI